jgi:hypothetical protein
MMAVSSPDRNSPLTPWRISFFAVKKKKANITQLFCYTQHWRNAFQNQTMQILEFAHTVIRCFCNIAVLIFFSKKLTVFPQLPFWYQNSSRRHHVVIFSKNILIHCVYIFCADLRYRWYFQYPYTHVIHLFLVQSEIFLVFWYSSE